MFNDHSVPWEHRLPQGEPCVVSSTITAKCPQGQEYGVVASHYVLWGEGTHKGTHLIPRATTDAEQIKR